MPKVLEDERQMRTMQAEPDAEHSRGCLKRAAEVAHPGVREILRVVGKKKVAGLVEAEKKYVVVMDQGGQCGAIEMRRQVGRNGIEGVEVLLVAVLLIYDGGPARICRRHERSDHLSPQESEDVGLSGALQRDVGIEITHSRKDVRDWLTSEAQRRGRPWVVKWPYEPSRGRGWRGGNAAAEESDLTFKSNGSRASSGFAIIVFAVPPQSLKLVSRDLAGSKLRVRSNLFE